MGLLDMEQDKRVEVNPLYGWRISRKINNLHIFKNMSFGIKYMMKFLPMFKEKRQHAFLQGSGNVKAAGILESRVCYTQCVHVIFPKIGMSKCSI
jgi:hypothetical protein